MTIIILRFSTSSKIRQKRRSREKVMMRKSSLRSALSVTVDRISVNSALCGFIYLFINYFIKISSCGRVTLLHSDLKRLCLLLIK